MHLDCRSLDVEHVPFDSPDVAVLIVDSRASRELRGGAYAERRAQCELACKVLGVDSLRDATLDDLKRAAGALGDVPLRRARHIVTENARVSALVSAVRTGDWPAAGRHMYDSHESMARDFEISCRELDVLVDLARGIGPDGGVFGARMTGGGFGGCIVVLAARDCADDLVRAMTPAYRSETGLSLRAYVSSPSSGAHRLDLASERAS